MYPHFIWVRVTIQQTSFPHEWQQVIGWHSSPKCVAQIIELEKKKKVSKVQHIT